MQALAIAIIGVAGVLAFSVSGRTRKFGIRLAVESQPRNLVTGVIMEGAVIAFASIFGTLCGFGLARLAGYVENIQPPGAVPAIEAAAVLLIAAVLASLLPPG